MKNLLSYKIDREMHCKIYIMKGHLANIEIKENSKIQLTTWPRPIYTDDT